MGKNVMGNYMVIRHTVSDFPAWKIAYEAHGQARTAAGLTEKHLLQDADNSNQVMIIFEADDLKRAEEFSNSDDLRETMQKAGVLGKPDIYFLKG
jgi:hypothetical protein